MGVVGEFLTSFIKSVFQDGIPEASLLSLYPKLIRWPHISGTVFGALGLDVKAGFMSRIHLGVLMVRMGFLGGAQSKGEPRSALETWTGSRKLMASRQSEAENQTESQVRGTTREEATGLTRQPEVEGGRALTTWWGPFKPHPGRPA